MSFSGVRTYIARLGRGNSARNGNAHLSCSLRHEEERPPVERPSFVGVAVELGLFVGQVACRSGKEIRNGYKRPEISQLSSFRINNGSKIKFMSQNGSTIKLSGKKQRKFQF